MFAFIRRHQAIGLAFILLVIVSFIVFFSPNMRNFDGHDDNDMGSINGRTIGGEEYRSAYRETEIFYFFQHNGEWPDRSREGGVDLDNEAFNRLFMIEKIKENGIEVPREAVAQFISDFFKNPRESSTETYQRFLHDQLKPHGITGRDFERFAEHEVGRRQLIAVIGLAGRLISPQAAETLYRRDNEPTATAGVWFNSSNYLAQVAVTPAALSNYYRLNASRYALPPRVRFTYAYFPVTNYLANVQKTLAGITNLNAALEAQYRSRGTNAFLDAQGKPLPKETALKNLLTEVQEERALLEARRQAAHFLSQVIEAQPADGKPEPKAFEQFAASNKISLATSPLVAQDAEHANTNFHPAVVEAAFQLTEEEPFSRSPIVTEKGVYALKRLQRVEVQTIPLDRVRDKVVQDLKRSTADDLARAAAEKFLSSATNALAAGRSFDQAAKEAGVTPVAFPPITRSTSTVTNLENRVNLQLVKAFAFAMQPGKELRMIPARDGNLVFHVSKKLPVDEAKLKEELPAFLDEVRQSYQSAAFGEWFRRELTGAKIIRASAAAPKGKS